jgi:uncharacterized protein YqiB (DUF1249 family)
LIASKTEKTGALYSNIHVETDEVYSIGTKFDEVLSVAQLLVDLTVGSVNRISVRIYNETEVVEAIGRASA